MSKGSRLFLAVTFAIGMTAASAMAQSEDKSAINEIRQELLQLPYFGVFDYLAFKYDKGTVTLLGYAYHPALKDDAEAAVKRAANVETVENRIEELPVAPGDDDLRWQTYYAIYRDPFLAHYAPGGGELWGHRHGPGAPDVQLFGAGDFAGFEPAGDYPIHIIVKNGRMTLMGVVDNEDDKTVAFAKARQVAGSVDVEDKLMVEGERPTATAGTKE